MLFELDNKLILQKRYNIKEKKMGGFLQKGFMYASTAEICFEWTACGIPSHKSSSMFLTVRNH